MTRLCNFLEDTFLTLLILIGGPFIIITGLGAGVMFLVFLVRVVPYLLVAGCIWLVVSRWKRIRSDMNELPKGAYEVKRPLFSVTHKGKKIPIGVLIFSIGISVLISPFILVMLFCVLPWWVLAWVIGISIVGSIFKGKREID